jgi:D-threonine aldolase
MLADVETPSLVFFADRIRANTEKALIIAGSPGRLWPHIKTHKTLELIEDLIQRGITRFKCATIAEAELLAMAGAQYVLVAYPLVGPNVERFSVLTSTFPETRFCSLVETRQAVDALAAALEKGATTASVFIDLDVGMGRTGMLPGDSAVELCRHVSTFGVLEFLGLHAYDGHNHQKDLAERKAACAACVEVVRRLKTRIEESGASVQHMIFGGTPTFPCYAEYPDADLSPGTSFLFDWGYGSSFPDLPFEPAAFVVGRVIHSKPGEGFTLDIGSKAIATDPAGQRGMIVELPDAIPVAQSEEHWVFTWTADPGPAPGDEFLVVPTHICPTVNLHEKAFVVNGQGLVTEEWQIVGRSRKLTV